MADKFQYLDESYELVGINGSGLYSAESFGLNPRSASTACWRGYVMQYKCLEKQFILDEMYINTEEPVELNGVTPQKPEVGLRSFFKHQYKNLKLKTKFTGTLLFGKDLIESMYVHMGFQSPMAFEKVIMIDVKNGDVISIQDVSEEMEKARKADPTKDARPRSGHADDIMAWVKKRFSQDLPTK